MEQTYYTVLGLTRTASDAEIKKAYRRLAKLYHPDKNPGYAPAEEKFRQITEAYETLSAQEKRFWYDRKLDVEAAQSAENEPPPPQFSPYDHPDDVPYYKWKMAALVLFVLIIPVMFLLFFEWDTNDSVVPGTILIKTEYGFIEVTTEDPRYEAFKEAAAVIEKMKENPEAPNDTLYLKEILERLR